MTLALAATVAAVADDAAVSAPALADDDATTVAPVAVASTVLPPALVPYHQRRRGSGAKSCQWF